MSVAYSYLGPNPRPERTVVGWAGPIVLRARCGSFVTLAVFPRFRTMDECRSSRSEQGRQAEAVVPALREKRRRFHELISTQRTQLVSLEQALGRQWERLQSALSSEQSTATHPVDLTEFEAQRTAIAREAESLAQLSSKLDVQQRNLTEFETQIKAQGQSVVEQLAKQQSELDERSSDLESAGRQLRQAQRTLAASEEALVGDREQVALLRARLQEQVHAVEQERESLSLRRCDTNTQRRRIARELQRQHHAQKVEITQQREAHCVEREALRSERAQLCVEREALRSERAQLLEEIESLRVDHHRLQQEQSARLAAEEHADGETERLREEIETLRTRLAEAELCAASESASEVEDRKRDDFKRRFELAMEDIRDLKRRNAELEEQLGTARSGSPIREIAGAGGKLDWEAQKRQLLASLGADDDGEPESAQKRMSIEGTIRITDEIVARKDQEIAELNRMLEEQSSHVGSAAMGANAIAEMLDQDELVRQERENLKRLQSDWRERLRQAEVDISVERARMARERLELDEKLQSLEAERDRLSGEPIKPGKGVTGSAAQRRWWARLGLKEEDKG